MCLECRVGEGASLASLSCLARRGGRKARRERGREWRGADSSGTERAQAAGRVRAVERGLRDGKGWGGESWASMRTNR